jgi:energy-coupling factor transport system substrate-specific component
MMDLGMVNIRDQFRIEKVNFPKLSETYIISLVAVGVALNVVLSAVRIMLQLPLFLDQGGMMLVSMLAGPWWGIVTAILSNVVRGLLINPQSLIPVTWLTPITTALVWGFGTKYSMTRSWPKYAILLVVLAFCLSAVTSTWVVYLFGGVTGGGGADLLFAILYKAWGERLPARFWAEFPTSIVDKVILSIIVLSIVRAIPNPEVQKLTPWYKGKVESKKE